MFSPHGPIKVTLLPADPRQRGFAVGGDVNPDGSSDADSPRSEYDWDVGDSPKKSAAAVPGWIGGGENDAKYSKIIRDDGAVDADSVVELDDGTKIAEQKKKTASAVSQAQVTAAKALASASNSGNKTGRHPVCKIFPCDDETARALKVASVLLAAVGLSMGVVSCVYKRRSHSFFYSRVRTNPDDDL